MPKSKKLENKISEKLDKLVELLDNIDEARIINSDDPETWNSDTLYNLVANLKKAQQLLEDKKHSKEKDPWGEPLVLEAGLCTLVNEYQEDEEESEDF